MEILKIISIHLIKAILSNAKTDLKRNELIEMFDDKENFILCHKTEIDYQF